MKILLLGTPSLRKQAITASRIERLLTPTKDGQSIVLTQSRSSINFRKEYFLKFEKLFS